MIHLVHNSTITKKGDIVLQVDARSCLKFGAYDFSDLMPSVELQEWKAQQAALDRVLYFELYRKYLLSERRYCLHVLQDLVFMDRDVYLLFSCSKPENCIRSVIAEELNKLEIECECL